MNSVQSRIAENQRIRGHQLLTKELRARLPQLYAGEGQGLKALAQVRFFTPDSHWSWYASEFDGQDAFFGLVAGEYIELGYFSLSELELLRGPWKLPVERDFNFTPTPLEELQAYHRKEGWLG